MKKTFILLSCALCLSAFPAVTRETEWQNIPDTAKVKEVVDLAATTGGTTNYNALANKPKVNGVELVGEKSLHDLDIQVEISDLQTIRSGAASGATAVQPAAISDMETKTSARANYQPKGDYLTEESDPVWNAQKGDYQPKLVSGTNIKTVNGNSLLGSGNVEVKSGDGLTTNVVKDIVRPIVASASVAATNYTDSAVTAATNGLRKVTGNTRVLPRYAHFETMDDSYWDEAKAYYAKFDDANVPVRAEGGCSAVRFGNTLGRNFDWNYDETPEWVVKVPASGARHGSVCVSVFSSGGGPTEDEVNSGAWTNVYRLLPGVAVDGINDAGVVVEVNVIPTNAVDPVKGVDGRDLSAKGVVRWVLDNASNASSAAAYVAAHYYIPAALRAKGYSYHWMIADATSTWIVEDGQAVNGTHAGLPTPMTNYPLYREDDCATGWTRYALMDDLGASIDIVAVLPQLRFSNAYATNSLGAFPWPDEFAGSVDAEGPIPYYADARLQAWAAANVAPRLPPKRGAGFWWQTMHSSLYDISNRTVGVCFQEDFGSRYVFACPVGTDEAKVREIVQPIVKAATNGLLRTETDPKWNAEKSGYVPWANAALKAVTIGWRSNYSAVGECSLAQGGQVDATGYTTHAEGFATRAEGYATHAEGDTTHAEGYYTHAEGYTTHAEGYATHAEGYATHAEGYYTHAEGYYTHAEGYATHAEGFMSSASDLGTFTYQGFDIFDPHSFDVVSSLTGNWESGTDYGTGDYVTFHGFLFKAKANHLSAATNAPPVVEDYVIEDIVVHKLSIDYATNQFWEYDPIMYRSHGIGTFNINPVGGLDGFWIGEKTMRQHIKDTSPAPGNYAAVSNAAMNAIQAVTNADANLIYTITSDGAEPRFYFTPVGAINAED